MPAMTAAVQVPERFNAADFFLDRHAREGRGGRPAFRYRGRALTYTEIALRASRFGNLLLKKGIEMEQRVLLALPDCREFAEAFWGAMKIGAVPVPVSEALTADEYAFLLNDSRARVVVAGPGAAREILAIREQCPRLAAVIALERAPRGALAYERLLERASPELGAADTSADDTALWLYTSGTTGRPKAAVHLHHDLLCAAELVGRGVFGIGPDDLIFSVSKLHFAFGLGNSLDFIANRPGHVRPGSCGQLIPGFEARLLDDEGRPVITGGVGHLLIKGDSTAPGYWNRHERTKATMLGEWLRTGDMFYQDTDGYFYFCGRADDMLKVGGMWVSPAEVEACLMEHPAVLEAAVIGRPDGDGLTKPHAFCVLKAGTAPGDAVADDIRALVKKRLAGYKAPRWVDFVADLPKTATGKIQRFRLRAA